MHGDRRDEEAFRALAEDAPELTDRPGWRVGLQRITVDTRPLRYRNFRNLWIGQSISFFGSNITGVAIPYQTYQLTGSTLAVGLIALAELVPLLTLAVVGGTIADAVDRRRLLLVTEVGLVACSALLVVNATLAEPRVWALFVLAAAITSLWALGSPALRSLTPRLVPEDQLAAASAAEQRLPQPRSRGRARDRRAADRRRRAHRHVPDRRRHVRRVADRRSGACRPSRRTSRPSAPACARWSRASASSSRSG